MKATDALMEIRRSEGIKVTTIASRMGLLRLDESEEALHENRKTINKLVKRFEQDNISVSVLHSMLQAMDYEIVLVPRGTKIPEKSYRIE